jgi:hypothetical protein
METAPVVIGKFFAFHSVLPTSDVGTDLYTVRDLFHNGHVYWALVSLFWIFFPCIARMVMVLIGWVSSFYRGQEFDLKTNLKMAVLQIPLVTSVRMVWNTLMLNEWRDGLHFYPADAAKIEAVFIEASSFSVNESFLEAGPQLITQGFIICSTGQISLSQMISIPLSLTSLTFAASKTFFTARDKENQHPDPSFRMIVQKSMAYMFIMVLSSTVMWSFITGLVGQYVIFGLAFNVLVVFLCLQIEKRCTMENEKTDDLELMTPKGAKLTTDVEPEESFNLQSALLSTWVPSVVGNSPKAFLVSGLVSLAVKSFLLSVVYASAVFSQFWVHAREAKIFLFWCLKEEFEDEYNSTSTVFCSQFGTKNSSNLPACFQIGRPEIVQKTRICNSDEMWLRLSILAVLVTCVVLSLISIIRLHHLTDWLTLTDSSTRFLCCIPCRPIYHRAALLKVMQKGTPDLEKFLAYYQDTVTKSDLLSTTYSNGENGVETAGRRNMWDQCFTLMHHGGAGRGIVYIMLEAHRGDMIQRLMENVFVPTISALVDDKKDELITAVLTGSPYPGLSDLVAVGPKPVGEEDNGEAANVEEVSNYLSTATALLQAGARPKFEVNQSGMKHWTWTYGKPDLGLALGVWAVAQGEEKMKADKIVQILLKDCNVKIYREKSIKKASRLGQNIAAWNLAHKEMKIKSRNYNFFLNISSDYYPKQHCGRCNTV